MTDSKRLSALAQLVEIHMANGMTATTDLSAQTGYTSRAIRKAKAELQFRNYSSGVGTPVPELGTPVPQVGTIVPPEPSRAYADIASHANNESSSKILSCSGGEEIEGLNGHTQHFIDLVFNFGSRGDGLGNSHTKLEVRDLLISELANHSPEKVKQGIADVQRKKPPRPIEMLGRYIANARPEAMAVKPKDKPHWQRTDEENNAATLAAMKRDMELM